jgi:hypothetical protein
MYVSALQGSIRSTAMDRVLQPFSRRVPAMHDRPCSGFWGRRTAATAGKHFGQQHRYEHIVSQTGYQPPVEIVVHIYTYTYTYIYIYIRSLFACIAFTPMTITRLAYSFPCITPGTKARPRAVFRSIRMLDLFGNMHLQVENHVGALTWDCLMYSAIRLGHTHTTQCRHE